MGLVNASVFAPVAKKDLYATANISTFTTEREMLFTATETTTRFYITKGWSTAATTATQQVDVDYLTILELPSQINYITCVSINENITMLANNGVNTNDSVQVRNNLNGYYNRSYSYAAYSQVLSGCANNTLTYVLAQPGIEAQQVEDGYRFGFNGMEQDDEVVGSGNSYTTELRQYDPRLGRWFSIDTEQGHPRLVPWSPYHFGYNNPLTFIDTEGNIPWSAVLAFFTRVSSEMGLRKHPITKVFTGHAGMDIATPVGTPVNAMADGVIMKIGWDVKLKNGKVTGYGRYVVIKHKDGHYSLYAHLEKDGVKFKEGDPVLNGQEFAASGNTGGSTGPHLHLEVIKANSDADIFNKDNKLNPRDVGDLQEYLNGGKKEFNLKDYYAQEIREH